MSRIRAIKPEFFRHEGLQALESENPGHNVMLVFAGLWTQCDKLGHFEWKPRTLKLDILPFLDFDMAGTLAILEQAGYIGRYEVDGKAYGVVHGFVQHQRVSGKEAQSPARFPPPIHEEPPGSDGEAPENTPRRNGEAPEKQQGVQERSIQSSYLPSLEVKESLVVTGKEKNQPESTARSLAAPEAPPDETPAADAAPVSTNRKKDEFLDEVVEVLKDCGVNGNAYALVTKLRKDYTDSQIQWAIGELAIAKVPITSPAGFLRALLGKNFRKTGQVAL